MSIARLREQREPKRGAVPQRALHPDASSVPLDDAPTDREPDAAARMVPLVQPLKHFKDAFGVLHIESDAIVAHRELPALFVDATPCPDVYPQRPFRSAILEGVLEQILNWL